MRKYSALLSKFTSAINHLSKFLVVSTSLKNLENVMWPFIGKFPNSAAICEENQKITFRNVDMRTKIQTQGTFGKFEFQNLLEHIFPDKFSNLLGSPIYAAYNDNNFDNALIIKQKSFFMELVAEKLNGTLKYNKIKIKEVNESLHEKGFHVFIPIIKAASERKLDFYLNGLRFYGGLQSYEYEEKCFWILVPPSYYIYEQILFMPLELSCWIWLGDNLTPVDKRFRNDRKITKSIIVKLLIRCTKFILQIKKIF